MSIFKYMEYATDSPSNRNNYDISKNVIRLPFIKENRLKEYWRSMYIYKTDTPTEKDEMFGNFYLECDEEDFNTNKNIIIDVCDHLNTTYKIPYTYLDLFITNRSIWLSVPAKVFNCFGSKQLNVIYKEMAIEINSHIVKQNNKKGLDLSIYKWNGLIHSLGSYLKNSKRWVTKFNYFDLINSYTIEDLLKSKYDNNFTYNDIEPIDEAIKWYNTIRNRIFNISKCISAKKECYSCSNRLCMNKLEENGYIEENRNLHIYTYSLYLKEKGYNFERALSKVKSVFNIEYVNLRECEKTVKSAINGKKNFNCKVVRELLNKDLFDCNKCQVNKSNKTVNQIIIPRDFITALNKDKVNYKTYKILIEILYSEQVEKIVYEKDLTGEKYKKDILKCFDVLKKLQIIDYSRMNNKIIIHSTNKDNNLYKNYINIPISFILSRKYKKMQQEIKLFLELCRISFENKNRNLTFNVKISTLVNNLKTTVKTILKNITILKKLRILLKNTILFKYNKQIVNKLALRIKKKGTIQREKYIKYLTKRVITPTGNIMKCIYSVSNSMYLQYTILLY